MLGARYYVTGNVDRRFILLYGLVGIEALFGLLAYFTADKYRREVALSLAAATGIIFCISGLAIGLGSAERLEQYSTDEILVLADFAERNGQYETATDRLEELNRRVKNTTARESIKKRINRLEALQAGTK